MSSKRKKNYSRNHTEYEFDDSDNFYDEIVQLPNENDSGDSDSDLDDESYVEEENMKNYLEDLIDQYSYKKLFNMYIEDQSKLENDHNYVWVDGEKEHRNYLQDEFLLNKSQKKKIHSSSYVELFELFFFGGRENLHSRSN